MKPRKSKTKCSSHESTLSKTILSRVIGSVHSYQLWDKVYEYFNTQTKARARQLRTSFHSTTLDGKSMREFLTQIKNIIDELTRVGSPMSLEEYVDVVLEGLPEEYAPVVSVIESKFITPLITEVEALLLAHELRANKFHKQSFSPSINYTRGYSRGGVSSKYFRDRAGGNSGRCSGNSGRCSGKGSKRGRGSRFANFYCSSKLGAAALGEIVLAETWSFSSKTIFLQLHTQGVVNSTWIPDFGASFHVTGNGQGLQINGYGSSSFLSPINSQFSFQLNNLLHVPYITKNMLSVSKFVKDNYLFFEFHTDHCFVKSPKSNEILLIGIVGADVSSSSTMWHTRLDPRSVFFWDTLTLTKVINAYPLLVEFTFLKMLFLMNIGVSNSLIMSHSPHVSSSHNVCPSSTESSSHSMSSFVSSTHTNNVPRTINNNPMQTCSKYGFHNPWLHPSLFLAHSEPKNVKQALVGPNWLSAMQQEYISFIHNHTWDLVPLPSNRKVVGCKWVFRVKENVDGFIDKLKARLVQKVLIFTHNWKLFQLDVNNFGHTTCSGVLRDSHGTIIFRFSTKINDCSIHIYELMAIEMRIKMLVSRFFFPDVLVETNSKYMITLIHSGCRQHHQCA
uniref:Retrovirus-related Pol polyprotein from transposon TNT 1-94 n=1 Tax=Cajanus cajan TaxID=3821 RepID=A0A151RQX9_CAJCA|nr:hypothetical protein KK1_033590 [Cajanus cajan]